MGFKDSRLKGFKDSRIQGFKDCIVIPDLQLGWTFGLRPVGIVFTPVDMFLGVSIPVQPVLRMFILIGSHVFIDLVCGLMASC